MDTFNKFFVGVTGGKVTIVNPPRGDITREDALMLAAWLVVMAGKTGEIAAAIEAVEQT
jgi:hypothetical protein